MLCLAALLERRRRWRTIVSMVMLLSSTLVICTARAVDLPIAIFGGNAGLDRQNIRVFHQDRDGLVWAGSNKGLYVFDGVGFLQMDSTQGFQPSAVTGMVEDASGDLWVATQAGLQVRHQGRFTSVAPAEQPLIADLGQTLVAQTDGSMLVVSHHRLLILTKEANDDWTERPLFSLQQRQQDPALDEVGIVALQDDAIWLSCGDQLCRFQKGQISHFGVREGVVADAWQDILFARDGSLWVQGRHEFLKLAAGAAVFVEQHLPGGQAWPAPASGLMAQDAHGDIVVGTNTGLFRREGSDWKAYGNLSGLMPMPIEPVSTVLADRDGSLWVGNQKSGVLHWVASRTIETWSSWSGWGGFEPVALRRIDALTLWIPDDVDLWSGIGDQSGQRWPMSSLPLGQAHLDRTARDGSVWSFHFDGQITRRRPGESRPSTITNLKGYIRGVKTSHSGEFWIYTQGGVVALNPANAEVTYGSVFLPGTNCFDVAEDPAGNMWAACDSGIYRNKNGEWGDIWVSPVQNAGGYEKIAIMPDGRLWIATTHAELLMGRATTSKVLTVQPVGTGALPGVTRLDFLETDRRGWLWVGSSTGLDVFNGVRWTHLGARDGLLLDESGANVFFADRDGSIWIASKVGLSHLIDPQQLLVPSAWQVKIIVARYGERDLLPELSMRFVQDEALTFHLAVIGNSTGNPVRFRYRMIGIDKDWRETNDSTVSYSPAGPGKFRFQAQAIDENQGRTSAPVEWAFALTSPWWRLPWATLLALSFLVAGMALAWHWRSRALIAKNRQLEQRVDRRTAQLKLALHARNDLLARISHDLRAPLANIIECVNRWRAGDAKRDYPRIIEQSIWQQIGLIDDLLEFAQGEHANAELEEVAGYLHAFLAEIVSQAGLLAERNANQFTHRFDDHLPMLVKADFRRLRRVLLNLLGNAAKFTHEGLVKFEVAVGQVSAGRVRLHFAIRDNGIGIGADRLESLVEPFVRGSNVEHREGKGLGLSIVTYWLDRMHSRLQLHRMDSGGSEFSFAVDFNMALESEVDSSLLDDDPMETNLHGDGGVIVVVDDQPQNCDMLCDLLDSYGFTSFPANSVEAALRIVEVRDPIMVITDQYMDDMGGWALLEALRKTHANLPVVICSASPPRRPTACEPGLEFDAVLLKPVRVRQLLQVVGRLSGRWKAEGACT